MNERAETGRTLEEPLWHDDRVPGLNDVVQLRSNLLLFAADDPRDADACRRTAIHNTPGEGQRLQHGRVLLLQRIRTRVFAFADTVDGSRPGEENRVPVAQPRCVRDLAVLHRPQDDAGT